MTALERLERLKVHYPLCPNCKHAKELITTLACKITRKEFPLFQPVYAWKEIVFPKENE